MASINKRRKLLKSVKDLERQLDSDILEAGNIPPPDLQPPGVYSDQNDNIEPGNMNDDFLNVLHR